MKPSLVYMAVNRKNGKRYIGVTSSSLNRRKYCHKSHAKRNLERDRNNVFYKAIRKYGFESFFFFPLAFYSSFEDALKGEMKFISEVRPEYNTTLGGEGSLGRKMSEETKKKINEWRKDPIKSQESSEKNRERGFKNKDRWQQYSHLGPKKSSRKVICLDDMKLFNSASEAARYYDVCKSAVIEMCLNKRHRKSVGGKKFMYISSKEAA